MRGFPRWKMMNLAPEWEDVKYVLQAE